MNQSKSQRWHHSKYVVFLIIALLISSSFSFKNACDDKSVLSIQVYNSCIDSLLFSSKDNSKIILRDTTLTIVGTANKDVRKILGDSICYQLHMNFKELNTNSEIINKKQLRENKRVLYLSDVYKTLSVSAKENPSTFWYELKFKYPMIKSIIGFSKVSFTENNDYAIVLMSDLSQELHNITSLIYLKRDHKRYKIIYIK